MYSLRFILKNAKLNQNEMKTEKDVSSSLSIYAEATHVKIKDQILTIYNPNNNKGMELSLDKFGWVFINHYSNYSITEFVKAYNTIVGAYQTLNFSKNKITDYDNIVAFSELYDTLFSLREEEVLNAAIDSSEIVSYDVKHNFNKETNFDEFEIEDAFKASQKKNNKKSANENKENKINENNSFNANNDKNIENNIDEGNLFS